MLNVIARAHVNRVTEPFGRWLVRLGVTPDAVTVAGTLGSVAAALWFLPRGQLFFGTLGVTVFVLFDLVDGAMARAKGKGTPFGAVLDSTCDRIADGALFVGAAASGANMGQPLLLWSSLVAIVASFLVPYVRAKAESLGVGASVGPAPREARIVIFLIGLAAWALFNLQWLFVVAVLALALLSSITFVMRVVHVARQLSIKER